MTESIHFPSFPPAPNGGYKGLSADPPWKYDDSLPGPGRGAESHYDSLHPKAIAGMAPQVRAITAPNAHLHLWCTNSFIGEAYHVAEAWGFTPKTVVTWVKVTDAPETLPYERDEPAEVSERIGMGHYYRNTTEHMLFAVKGSLSTFRNDAPTHLFAERTEHSAKPEKAYRLIEDMSPGPYLDMFARESRDGWDAWGAEIGDE